VQNVNPFLEADYRMKARLRLRIFQQYLTAVVECIKTLDAKFVK